MCAKGTPPGDPARGERIRGNPFPPVRSRVPAPPGVFFPSKTLREAGHKRDTRDTRGHTADHTVSQSQTETKGSHYTQPSTQPSRSRPTKNAHTHDRETSRPQTVPRSHCPEPTRPQRTGTSARERARRDAPEPTVETEPAEPATEPPRPTLFRKRARSREPPRRPPPGPHLPPANPRPGAGASFEVRSGTGGIFWSVQATAYYIVHRTSGTAYTGVVVEGRVPRRSPRVVFLNQNLLPRERETRRGTSQGRAS